MKVTGLVLSSICLAAACSSHREDASTNIDRTAEPDGAQSWMESPSVRSNDGNFIVVYESNPEPIPLNNMFALNVQIRDFDKPSHLVPGVGLSVDAAMPVHRHGMNTRPTVERAGVGRFRVEGMLFHMSGHWELYFDITRGAITERAQVDVDFE